MDLSAYRNSRPEQARTQDLIALLPRSGGTALDVGARDGYISVLLTDHFDSVIALDLDKPEIEHGKIRCVKGDATALNFPDRSIDLVVCLEVLEHIPTQMLAKACLELARVAKGHVLVGVPYKQDIRCSRTTCYSCGKTNPPWGHVNSFDETRLQQLFGSLTMVQTSYVGESDVRTNAPATWLMDLAGNPYGSYAQDEPCVHCGEKLKEPPPRTSFQKVCTKAALSLTALQKTLLGRRPHGNWIHVLMEHRSAGDR